MGSRQYFSSIFCVSDGLILTEFTHLTLVGLWSSGDTDRTERMAVAYDAEQNSLGD